MQGRRKVREGWRLQVPWMIDEIESFLASGTKTCPKLSSSGNSLQLHSNRGYLWFENNNWFAWKLQIPGYVTYHPIRLDEHFPFLDIEEIENLIASLFSHSEEIRSSQDTSYTVLLLLAEENANILADKREPADCRVGPLNIHTRHDLKSWSHS